MYPNTGEYVEHQDNQDTDFIYYTFIPRPLKDGLFYKMDDELAALLADTHQKIGFLEGVLKHSPNKHPFQNLMRLRECVYSLLIDYKSLEFEEALYNCGTEKGNVAPITNLVLAYEAATNRKLSTRELCRLSEIALYGSELKETITLRNKKIFFYGLRSNLKTYNPTAPEKLMPALADIYSFSEKSQDDFLIKMALSHYQLEMIHPFELGNGIVGRMIFSMQFPEELKGAAQALAISELLYHSKNEYFDLLSTTQQSGGYIRWIKYFVQVVNKSARYVAKLLEAYERMIFEDENCLKSIAFPPKSVWRVYDYLKGFPIVTISHVAQQTELSFNSVSKALLTMQESGMIRQIGSNSRNRVWEYTRLVDVLRQNS